MIIWLGVLLIVAIGSICWGAWKHHKASEAEKTAYWAQKEAATARESRGLAIADATRLRERLERAESQVNTLSHEASEAKAANKSWDIPKPEVQPTKSWNVTSDGGIVDEVDAHDYEIDTQTRTVVFYQTQDYEPAMRASKTLFVKYHVWEPVRVKVFTFNLDHVLSIEEETHIP